MNYWQAFVLGLVQGITEFLPISSDGHLAMFESWLGLSHVPVSFAVIVHVATLGAVIVYSWKSIISAQIRDWLVVVVATLPVIPMGFLLKDSLPAINSSRYAVSVGFLITALILWLADSIVQSGMNVPKWQRWLHSLPFVSRRDEKVLTPDYLGGFLVGCLESLAILPGISRSGSTLLGGVAVGLSREAAFRFSFLLAIPAILGALTLDALDVIKEGSWTVIPWPQYLLSAVVAFLVGFAALWLLELIVKKWLIKPFIFYLVFVSILSYLTV